MANQQHSAEKDLLKLIENPALIESQKKDIYPDADSRTKKFTLKRKARSSGEAASSAGMSGLVFGRKQILQALMAITACVFIYFLFTVKQEYSKLKNTQNLAKFTPVAESKAKPKAAGELSAAKSAANLVDNSAEEQSSNETDTVRNIFKPGSGKKDEEKKDTVQSTMSDYRLVGISLAAAPGETYAMVKNAKTNLTFFLKKGELLDGMELTEIYENKLVFNVRGKSVELR